MKKKFIFILSLGLLANYSCKKSNLYPTLPTSISTTDYAPFSTVARIQAQVLGLYATMRNSTPYGGSFGGRYQVYNDVKADNWINSTANSVTAYQTWTETVSSTSSEVLNLWGQCYLAINNCNLFIDGMNAAGTSVVGSTITGNYIAEAKFIRALNYYALLEMYCQPYVVNNGTSAGVPLRLTGNSVAADYSLAPSTVAQVYSQIVADLTAAESSLPANYADATTNVTRASKNTAAAFLTRVYLSMGQYTNVITEANKIVSSAVPFTAASSGGVSYAMQATLVNVYRTYTTTESVFSMPWVNATETPGSQSALGAYFSGLASAEFYLNTSSALYTDAGWKTTDQRRALLKTSGTKVYSNKYATTSPYTDWAPVMRYPEVLLNLAEARVRSTNTLDAQAIALLNAVRQRSDATTTFTAANLGSVTGMINAILEERNIEFLAEGLRWNDLWRLDLPIPAKGSVTAVPASSSSYIWPMSGNEQIYNTLIGR